MRLQPMFLGVCGLLRRPLAEGQIHDPEPAVLALSPVALFAVRGATSLASSPEDRASPAETREVAKRGVWSSTPPPHNPPLCPDSSTPPRGRSTCL
jgi:hypothetical protein